MPSTGPKISPRNCAALQAAEAAGIEIVISTGRRQAYAMPLITQVGLSENSVMISSNGAVVRGFDGQLLDRRFLPVETARQLCFQLQGYGTLVFTFDREGVGALVIESFQQLHARIDRWVEANKPYLVEFQPIERAFDGGEEPIDYVQRRRLRDGVGHPLVERIMRISSIPDMPSITQSSTMISGLASRSTVQARSPLSAS